MKDKSHKRPTIGPSKTQTVTIFDVAEKAQVSIATVSRVLQNTSGYSEKTRDKVLAAVKTLRYTPNVSAQGLAQRHSNIVGVFGWFEHHSPSFYEMLLGIQDRFDGTSHTVHVLKWHNDLKEDRKVFEDFAIRHFASGVILLSRKLGKDALDIFKGSNIATVLTEYPSPHTDCVTIDNEKGGYLAGRHLIERGCRNISVIAGWPDSPFIEDRIRGFQKALKEAGLTSRGESYFRSNFKIHEGGYGAAKKILEQTPKTDGIFAAVGDIAAVGAIRYLKEKGLGVPNDVKVVGYDGLQDTAYFEPPLTTIQQPLFEMGHKAADRLISLLKKRDGKTASITLEPKLIVRETS